MEKVYCIVRPHHKEHTVHNLCKYPIEVYINGVFIEILKAETIKTYNLK